MVNKDDMEKNGLKEVTAVSLARLKMLSNKNPVLGAEFDIAVADGEPFMVIVVNGSEQTAIPLRGFILAMSEFLNEAMLMDMSGTFKDVSKKAKPEIVADEETKKNMVV